MDPAIYIGFNVGLVLLIIYVIDPNVYEALFLVITGLPTWVALRVKRVTLGTRLWIERQSFRPGLLGRLLTEIQLFQIRRNPAYRDLFDKIKSKSLQEGND